MTSLAASLASALPAPTYTGQDETPASKLLHRGPRIVGASTLDSTQITLRKPTGGPPPQGQRGGWRPRTQEDFGGGGAFPEIHVAQYPLGMGKRGANGSSSNNSNALALTLDGEGKAQFDAIARQGHGADRIIQASFKDLIPLRQRADAGELSLERPSAEDVEATKQRTADALAKLVSGAVAAQKPKNVNVGSKSEATFVRYTPASQMGDHSKKQDRIMKIVEKQKDPMEPPKFRVKKIPRGPPSPPPPVLRSPPRKLTAQDQEDWRIPPPVSNWKNPKGFTVPLDKRLAADGRGLQDVEINDKFAQFSEALFMADRHAREEVKQRALMQQRLAEKEKDQKEDHLRQLAQKAREERAAEERGANPGRGRGRGSRRRSRSSSYSDSRSRSRSRSSSYSSRSQSRDRTRRRARRDSNASSSEDEDAIREREDARREARREEERKLRQSRMGAERRVQVMAREQNRDISEKIALGLAKPTQSKEGMYDSRLFNQTSGFDSGFNEDNPYDKPLFAAQEAMSNIYRARGGPGAAGGGDEDEYDEEAGQKEMDKIQKTSRFTEVLGKGKFKGTEDVEAREGPVVFEKDTAGTADPFNVDQFLSEVDQQTGASKRQFGLQETGGRAKRARMADDE